MTDPLRVPTFRRWMLLATTVVGAGFLILLSAFQKSQLGVPLFNPAGYVVPVVFGGGAGLMIGFAYERLYVSRETLADFQRAIDAAGQAVILTDEDGAIQYVNGAFESMTGYTADVVRGRSPDVFRLDVVDDEAATAADPGPVETEADDSSAVDTEADDPGTVDVEADDSSTVETDTHATHVREGEVVCARNDGERFFAWQTVTRLDSGAHGRSITILTDVTDRSIREQQLSVLHRVIRHNLRNELTVIEGNLEGLEAADLEPGSRETLREIEARAASLEALSRKATMVQSTLDPRRQDRTVRPIGEMLESIVSPLSQQYPDADIAVQASIPDVKVDSRLEKAIWELVHNALEHSATTPSVEVNVERDGDGPVSVTVRDEGPGIPEGEQAPLRGEIETQLRHGSGLGLWIVYWVTLYCGGTVDVTTPEDGGTVVTVTVPCRFSDACEPGDRAITRGPPPVEKPSS